MKTKTIDDIIEIITLVRKSDISGINSELLIKCNKLLLEEKQRKEQKKHKKSLSTDFNLIWKMEQEGFREKKRDLFQMIYPDGKIIMYNEITFTDKPKKKPNK